MGFAGLTAEQRKRLYDAGRRLWPRGVTIAMGIAPGWFDIMLRLVRDLEAQAKREGRTEEDWPCFENVGAKYGGLRIDLIYGSPAMDRLVIDAENESERTCEKCGSTREVEQVEVREWVTTLCVDCVPSADSP